LVVSDREASAAFYREHFGLTERIHEDVDRLIVGSADWALVAFREGPMPRSLPADNHFGF
jgi:hypothetical protein